MADRAGAGENRCGWCGDEFETAADLNTHEDLHVSIAEQEVEYAEQDLRDIRRTIQKARAGRG